MRSGFLSLVFAVVPFIVAGCYGRGDGPASGTQPSSQPSPEQVLMERGLTSLYRNGDAIAAAATFSEVLARNPAHYGARYQLAVALDRAGKPDIARAVWTEVLHRADRVKDGKTAFIARSRLAKPDTVSAVMLMGNGLNFLRQGNPFAAAEQFRMVLERKPNHYGANYQLALALDRSGRRAEARSYWQKVLVLAESVKDGATAGTARARLSQKP